MPRLLLYTCAPTDLGCAIDVQSVGPDVEGYSGTDVGGVQICAPSRDYGECGRGRKARGNGRLILNTSNTVPSKVQYSTCTRTVRVRVRCTKVLKYFRKYFESTFVRKYFRTFVLPEVTSKVQLYTYT